MFRGLIPFVAMVAISCGGGAPTQPTVPASPGTVGPPNPPGPSSGPVAGTWIGTFDSSDPGDCASDTPATATFQQKQDEDSVQGILSAVDACGLSGIVFDGVFEDGSLKCSLRGVAFSGSAVGTISGETLELRTSDLWTSVGPWLGAYIPAGVMHLHRSE